MIVRSLLCVLLLGNMVAFGQEKAVPANVKKSLKKEFRSAESVSWYIDREDYEAQFLDHDIEKVAYYSKSTGKFIGVKELIAENTIPSPVMAAVRKSYPGFVLQEYYKMVPVKGDTTYVVGFDVEGQIITMEMKENGDVLKKEEE